MKLLITIIITLFFSFIHVQAQNDKNKLLNTSLLKPDSSTNAKKTVSDSSVSINKKDSVVKKFHDPHKATRRSLILPGLGQAYNREYWKIPLVYGALSIPVITFFFNNTEFKKVSFAYNALFQARYGSSGTGTPAPTKADSTDYNNIDPEILPGIQAGRIDLAALQNARNSYRRNRDYSAFWFLIAWGVNVVDATVFGHLKNFDVSPDLTMHIKPTFDPITKTPGIGLVFNYKNEPKKIKEIVR